MSLAVKLCKVYSGNYFSVYFIGPGKEFASKSAARAGSTGEV